MFLRLTQDRGKTKALFERMFKEHEIRIDGKNRQMRCYLVMNEGRMVQMSEEHRRQSSNFDPLLVDVSAVKHPSSYGNNSFGSWRRDISFNQSLGTKSISRGSYPAVGSRGPSSIGHVQ